MYTIVRNKLRFGWSAKKTDRLSWQLTQSVCEMDPKTEKTWKSLVYNVSITPSAVKEFYEGWAVLYDEDQVKLKTGK